MRNNPLRYVDPTGHQQEEVPPREELEREDAEFAEGMRDVDTVIRGRQAEAARQYYDKLPPEQKQSFDRFAEDVTRKELGPLYDQMKSALNDPGPYRRPSNATTPAQRASVQGKSCVTCGAEGQKNVADHKEPLVKEYYRNNGQIDKAKMRSLNAVQPQCQTCSNQQGRYLQELSQALKKLFGY